MRCRDGILRGLARGECNDEHGCREAGSEHGIAHGGDGFWRPAIRAAKRANESAKLHGDKYGTKPERPRSRGCVPAMHGLRVWRLRLDRPDVCLRGVRTSGCAIATAHRTAAAAAL